MSEIEVGEYVRTDNGEIHKVIDIEKGSIKININYKTTDKAIHLLYDLIKADLVEKVEG